VETPAEDMRSEHPAADGDAARAADLAEMEVAGEPLRETVARRLSQYMLLIVLAVMIGVFSVLLPTTFPTLGNLKTITSTQSVLIAVSLGLIFPLAAGEFDLSFGAVLGFSSSLLAVLTISEHWPLAPALGAVFATALLIGSVNSFFVVRLGVNSFIVTLGVSTVVTGLTLAVSGSQVIPGSPDLVSAATTGTLFGLQYSVYAVLVLALMCWYILQQTPIGRYIYFTGAGREVARLAGIPVDRIRTGSFLCVALVSAAAGVINLGTIGSADPNIGVTFLLPAFAAVFLGSTAIVPGRFNAWGTVIAVYLLVVGVTGIQLVGGAGYWEQIFNGAALVLAVTFARIVVRDRT
jgi:ribose transport system permease protein